jgi:hypothetical protein
LSLQRLKRLQKLESRRPVVVQRVDPVAAADALLVFVTRKACPLRVYGPWPEALTYARMKAFDGLTATAKRLQEAR